MFVEPVTLLPQSVSIATDTRVGKLQGFNLLWHPGSHIAHNFNLSENICGCFKCNNKKN